MLYPNPSHPVPLPCIRLPCTNTRTALDKVKRMPLDPNAISLAGEYGLVIQNVSWEDCARTKNSVWGPCISDMTLQVNNNPLPVIRLPNFTDVSWDQPMKNIPLNVGNEKGYPLHQISLYEYLSNFKSYLHNPSSWYGLNDSLLAPSKDSHVIMTSQACFLPIDERDTTKFNISLKSYQSRPSDPAVLVIVGTSSGTSAQIVDSSTAQTLYFNNNGERASFIAKRLKDQRRELGQCLEGEMNAEEKSDNMIIIIQVPLRQKSVHVRNYYAMSECAIPQIQMCSMISAAPMRKRSRVSRESCDVDQAIISVGASEGPFDELKNLSIERNPDYPVRVTLQYYKATSNGIVTSDIVEEIAVQMITARSFAEKHEIGSLVTSSVNSRRSTEPVFTIASWWSYFWKKYHPNFPDFSETQAKKLVFSSSRAQVLCNSPYYSIKDEVFSMLSSNYPLSPIPSKPSWNPSKPFQS